MDIRMRIKVFFVKSHELLSPITRYVCHWNLISIVLNQWTDLDAIVIVSNWNERNEHEFKLQTQRLSEW